MPETTKQTDNESKPRCRECRGERLQIDFNRNEGLSVFCADCLQEWPLQSCDYSVPISALGQFFPAQEGWVAVEEKELADLKQAARLLCDLYEEWEDGDDVFEDPENLEGYLGHAIRMKQEDEIIGILNRLLPSPPARKEGK